MKSPHASTLPYGLGRGGGGDRDPFKKNLSMLCETCRGKLCVMYVLNDKWYTHWERQETAGFVLPMSS